MATRSQLRAMLQRRLQDTENAQWSDATLNLLLNVGLRYMQKEIMKIDKMAFIYEGQANLVADLDKYPMPSNSMCEIGVYTRGSSTGEWAWQDYIDLPWIQAGGSANWDANPYASGYSRWGRYILLHPTPTAAVTTGLKLEYIPWLTMGSDSDIPEIDIGLHEGIVFRAEEVALGDTAQEAVKAKEDLAQVISDLPQYYMRRGAPSKLSPMATMALFEE